MADYKVIFDLEAGKQIKKSKIQKKQISKIINRLESNPENIGKFVEGSKGLIREIYIGSYRLYYTTIEDQKIVYVFEFTHKNIQQKTIDKIKAQKLKDIQKKLSKE